MEGPYITEKVDRDLSEHPEDSGFSNLLDKMKEKNPALAGTLSDINRSPAKKKIIEDALIQTGHDWSNLYDLRENSEAGEAFGHLMGFWNEPINGVPRTDEDRKAEALEFAKKLI